MTLVNQYGRKINDLDFLKLRITASGMAKEFSYGIQSIDSSPITGFFKNAPTVWFTALDWRTQKQKVSVQSTRACARPIDGLQNKESWKE